MVSARVVSVCHFGGVARSGHESACLARVPERERGASSCAHICHHQAVGREVGTLLCCAVDRQPAIPWHAFAAATGAEGPDMASRPPPCTGFAGTACLAQPATANMARCAHSLHGTAAQCDGFQGLFPVARQSNVRFAKGCRLNYPSEFGLRTDCIRANVRAALHSNGVMIHLRKDTQCGLE